MSTESTTALRREIERNRLRERQRLKSKLHLLSEMSPVEVARHLNRKCRHCGEYLTPWRGPDEWRGGVKWYWPDCHGCEQERVALQNEQAYQAMTEQKQKQIEYAQKLQNAGLVGWLAEATFENYKTRAEWPGAAEALKWACEYVAAMAGGDRTKPFLAMYGKYGNGKSHLAAATIHHFLGLGWTRCYFRVWPAYLTRIRASYRRSDDDLAAQEAEADIINELQSGELIVIDDLDKRKPTDFGREILFQVLNHRYNASLPTVLTFNLGPEDIDPKAPGRLALETFLGKSLIDRIIERAYMIEFDGPSYRSKIDW